MQCSGLLDGLVIEPECVIHKKKYGYGIDQYFM